VSLAVSLVAVMLLYFDKSLFEISLIVVVLIRILYMWQCHKGPRSLMHALQDCAIHVPHS